MHEIWKNFGQKHSFEAIWNDATIVAPFFRLLSFVYLHIFKFSLNVKILSQIRHTWYLTFYKGPSSYSINKKNGGAIRFSEGFEDAPFNFWTTLFSKIMPNFWITGLMNELAAEKDKLQGLISELAGEKATSEATLKELEAEKAAKAATQSDLSAEKSSHDTAKLNLGTLQGQLAAEKAKLEAVQAELGSEKAKLSKNLAELSVEKEKHNATKLELETANLPFWKKFGM